LYAYVIFSAHPLRPSEARNRHFETEPVLGPGPDKFLDASMELVKAGKASCVSHGAFSWLNWRYLPYITPIF
jgi:hypothetical protein